MLQTLLRPGQTERVEAALAVLDEHERWDPEIRATLASLRLAQHDPQAATATLAPIIDGSVGFQPFSVVAAPLLESMARGGSRRAGRIPRSRLLADAVPTGRESPKHVTPAHQAGREAAQVQASQPAWRTECRR